MSRALELARKGNYDALILDSSAAATDVAENLLLERTNVQDDDAGFYILQEDFGTETSQSNLNTFDTSSITPEEQVMFHVNLIANQTITTNTVTKLTFDYVNYNYRNNANCDDPAKVVIKIPGIYYLRHQTHYSATSDDSFGSYNYVYLYVNGSTVFSKQHTLGYGGGSGYSYVMLGSTITEGFHYLNIGDEIEGKVYFYKPGGTLTATTYGPGPNYRDLGIQGTLIKRMPERGNISK